MKTLLKFSLLFSTIFTCAQKDSIQINPNYLEDQLYVSVSYNSLRNQPSSVKSSSFSYGISTGFIKDIPLNKNRNLGIGLGLGYGFDSFNHGLKVEKTNNQYTFSTDNSLISNRLRIHNIEIPFEIRWRNSTLKKYEFWRVYAGFKVTYNFSHNFIYEDSNNIETKYSNIPQYNKWQTGLTLSAGYDAFNFYMYYGLTPILKDASLNASNIDTKIIKFGLIFYIL